MGCAAVVAAAVAATCIWQREQAASAPVDVGIRDATQCTLPSTYTCPCTPLTNAAVVVSLPQSQISVGKQLKSLLDMSDNTKIGFSVFVSTCR